MNTLQNFYFVITASKSILLNRNEFANEFAISYRGPKLCRNSRTEVFCEKVVLRNFGKKLQASDLQLS